MKTEAEEENRIYFRKHSLRTYSKKQVVLCDSLLVQETAKTGELLGPLGSAKGIPLLWSPHIWDLSDCAAVSKTNQDLCETVGSQCGKGTNGLGLWWARGEPTAAVSWTERTVGLLHSFPDPFDSFLHWPEHIRSRKKDYFYSI